MKILRFAIAAFLAATTLLTHSQQQNQDKLDRRIDSQGYWKAAAERGLTTPNPHVSVAPARYTGSEIMSISVITENSPDVVVVSGNTSQSENSIFVNPNDPENPLNSNNSTTQPGGGTSLYGADKLYSFDAGLTWQGDVQGPSGSNSGDPAALIGLNGRYYIGFINNASGQSVAWSDDQGATWQSAVVANAPSGFGNLLDKNHMWIDNSPSSPYEGNLYNAWTAFGGQNDNDIEVSRSTDDGATWSSTINVSNSLNAGSHSQGVNISTGPGGEVYVTFCIYDNWPSDEDAIAMARSLDGGQTYESFRVIENIRGIRNTGTGKDMRVNAFPSSAADISNGPNRGNIYIVWTNVGYPGINTGSDKDVYIIRSEDGGDTWSAPIRVNQDPAGLGKEHYLPWITCDPVTGTLSVIFYDDRNVSSAQCEVFCANSYDGGETWEDFKVSDVSFTPSPIPGLASGYFGDYTGTALAYVSPYTTSTISAPTNLSANVNEETGSVNLTWQHSGSPTFSYFKVYRNFTFLGQTVLPLFTDQLPAYGPYRYYVTAYYEAEGESGAAIVDVQWGNPQAQTDPQAIEAFLTPGSNTTIDLNLNNIGQLPLNYTSRFSIPGTAAASRAYCTGTGGCTEYIRRVEFNEVNNQSECNGYEDFTNLGTTVVVLNGTSAFSNDVCGIWIDWNQNENFTDDGAIAVSGSPGPGPYTATITVPDDAASGTTRMRIRIKRDAPVSPCGLSPNGEVEDYSINVIGWVSASPMDGTIDPGSSQPIAVELDAAGLDLGDYQVDYIISSNDPDNGEITVPVILHVTDIALQVSADKDSLCLGGSTTLHALATGGSGNFSYSWTSVPEGFTSTDPNPVVNPAVTTTYIVELTDGSMTLEEQITITVLDLPSVSLGDDCPRSAWAMTFPRAKADRLLSMPEAGLQAISGATDKPPSKSLFLLQEPTGWK